MAIAPPGLRARDLIGIVAPAGPTDLARLARGLELVPREYGIVLAPSLQAGHARSAAPRYLADSDEQRVDEFNAMLRNPDIRAIVMARGGYGLMRILPQLDGAALRADPKPIVGFSDGTALLTWAWHNGVRGIHGPIAQQFADIRAQDVSCLFELLRSRAPSGPLSWHLQTTHASAIEGPLVGGNANLISHLLATPWPVPTDDALLCIEDVGEKPYSIDRYLTHLGLAGAFQRARALVAGTFTRCMDPLPAVGAVDDPSEALAVIAERAHAHSVPLWQGAEFGHGSQNAPWPFGAHARLEGSQLIILDAAVA
jgi:muramoyltetrapeptide carboxypeptidase